MQKIYSENKKGYFNYNILEEYEAGIVLSGSEVKSIRARNISLKEAFATIKDGEIWLTNAHIAKYKYSNEQNYNPTRPRKLLLNRSEINKIIGKMSEKGKTLVPLKIYDKKGKIKVLLGVGQGKKKYDKRETLRRRDIDREAERDLKERIK